MWTATLCFDCISKCLLHETSNQQSDKLHGVLRQFIAFNVCCNTAQVASNIVQVSSFVSRLKALSMFHAAAVEDGKAAQATVCKP